MPMCSIGARERKKGYQMRMKQVLRQNRYTGKPRTGKAKNSFDEEEKGTLSNEACQGITPISFT